MKKLGKKGIILIICGLAAVSVLGIGGYMLLKSNTNADQKYYLENVSSYIGEDEQAVYEIHVGDIVLDEGFQLNVLPRMFDTVKKKEKEKVTNQPIRQSNRLLRIKKLNDNNAVVAILHQDYYYENDTTIVKTESEQVFEVTYGEPFRVYSKYVVYDAAEQPSYRLVIYKEGERPTDLEEEIKKPKTTNLPFSDPGVSTGLFEHHCSQCGYMAVETGKRKYCPDCGSPFKEENIKEIFELE